MELELYEKQTSAPAYELDCERPEHRILLYLKAKGYSTAQCARAMGKSEQWVLNTQKQPFFKNRLTALLHETGKDQVVSFLQINGMDAMQKMVDLMNESADERVQLAAASKLMDKVVPDKLDVQRTQQLPPAQLREQIKLVSEQIRLIEEGRPSEPTDKEHESASAPTADGDGGLPSGSVTPEPERVPILVKAE